MGIPKLNVNELLSRGGILSDAEMDQLCVDLSAEKLNELQQGTLEESTSRSKSSQQMGFRIPACRGILPKKNFS